MNSTKFCAQLTKRLLLTASNRHKTAKVVVRNFTASRVDATEWSSNVYSNPMRELQPLLQVPLTSLAEEIFNPSEREIGEGHEMLRRTDRNISLYKGEIRPESLPELNLPEVKYRKTSLTCEIYDAIAIAITIRFKNELCTHFYRPQGKVMFPQVFVCPLGGAGLGYLLSQVPSGGTISR